MGGTHLSPRLSAGLSRGLTHVQIATILRRLAAANQVVAAIITESQPALDHNAITGSDDRPPVRERHGTAAGAVASS